VRMSEDKMCTKDPCWSVGTIYDPRELPRVSTADPEVDEVLHYQNMRPSRLNIWPLHSNMLYPSLGFLILLLVG
jgi:hypothetical protein